MTAFASSTNQGVLWRHNAAQPLTRGFRTTTSPASHNFELSAQPVEKKYGLLSNVQCSSRSRLELDTEVPIMDPLTALSLAGTVLQFVDFSLKILTTGHRLYRSPSGSLTAHEELKWVARDISSLATRLSCPRGPEGVPEPSQDEVAIVDLCKKCEDIAQDFLSHLEALKIQGKRGAWKSFRLALKATWAQKDLDALVQKLQLVRKSVESWFLVDIRQAINPYRQTSYRVLTCHIIGAALIVCPYSS